MRFAIIDFLDCIIAESNDLNELFAIYYDCYRNSSRGIYDYQQSCYLDTVDIIDMLGCQLHSFG